MQIAMAVMCSLAVPAVWPASSHSVSDPAPSRCTAFEMPDPGSRSISVYEWRESAWRGVDARKRSTFARLRSLCITQVAVDITGVATATPSEQRRYADDLDALIERAGARGITVQAVAGDPYWAFQEGYRDVDAIMRFVADFQSDRDPGRGLSGIQFDSEPWGLEDWRAFKVPFVLAYLALVDHLVQQQIDLGSTGPIGFAIPYWFDGTNGEAPNVLRAGRLAPPFEHLVDVLDRSPSSFLVIMAYRKRAAGPGGTLEIVADEFRSIRDRGSPIALVVGVETSAIDPRTATFFGSSRGRFLGELRKTWRSLDEEASTFAGFAINDVPGAVAIDENTDRTARRRDQSS
jgi:hypothetical protein